MTKARARSAAKKVKDKWKAKTWYQILAPPLFETIPVAETLTDNPNTLLGRVTEVSLQDITNDFRKSHIKLFFKVYKVAESQAHTQVVGHALTSDYVRRMIRRRRSRIEGVYDVTTRDGAMLRVKPFAISEKRIQSSQKNAIRNVMKKTIAEGGATVTLNEYIRDAIDGKIGSDIYKNCKNLYPVKRIEISKMEVVRQPTIEIIEEKKPVKPEEPPAAEPQVPTPEQPVPDQPEPAEPVEAPQPVEEAAPVTEEEAVKEEPAPVEGDDKEEKKAKKAAKPKKKAAKAKPKKKETE